LPVQHIVIFLKTGALRATISTRRQGNVTTRPMLDLGCEPHFGGSAGRRGLKMVPMSSPVVTFYMLPIVTIGLSRRFRSAPTCHGRTDGRNWSSKRRLCAL